jgi:hypothetical protein
MVDFLFVVEEVLDKTGVGHFRDRMGRICFTLNFGETSYDCRIDQDGQHLMLNAVWGERVEPQQIDWVEQFLRRISKFGCTHGLTSLNSELGTLTYKNYVNLGMSAPTFDEVDRIIKALLDLFNIKVLSIRWGLDGELPEDVSMKCYAALERDRRVTLRRLLRTDHYVEPSLN